MTTPQDQWSELDAAHRALEECQQQNARLIDAIDRVYARVVEATGDFLRAAQAVTPTPTPPNP